MLIRFPCWFSAGFHATIKEKGMGLFDDMMGGVHGGGQENPILDLLLRLVGNPETGGLGGLVRKLQEQGLGDQVNSWVGTGENLPISADQLRRAFGQEGFSGHAPGLPAENIFGALANLMPMVIDQLTPKGALPADHDLGEGIAQLRKSLMGE